jgi:hypothetical protein
MPTCIVCSLAGRALATSTVAHTAPLQMALSDWVPQPVKRIISSVSGKKASSAPARGGSKEGVALFRQLGVSEDATFEEIQDVSSQLFEAVASCISTAFLAS